MKRGIITIEDFPIDRRALFARATDYVAPGANDYVMDVQLSAGQVITYRVYLTPIHAQVKGRLLDAITGLPIERARLWLGSQRRGVCNRAGRTLSGKRLSCRPIAPLFSPLTIAIRRRGQTITC